MRRTLGEEDRYEKSTVEKGGHVIRRVNKAHQNGTKQTELQIPTKRMVDRKEYRRPQWLLMGTSPAFL
jgi:hypothetical protein